MKFINLMLWTRAESEIASRRDCRGRGLPFGFDFGEPRGHRSPDTGLGVMDSKVAPYNRFIDQSWCSVRDRYGLTARRDSGELSRRFFRDRYRKHVILADDEVGSESGCVNIICRVARPHSADIHVIVRRESSPKWVVRLLTSALRWLKATRIRCLSFCICVGARIAGRIVSGLAK
jgi:hypothetical protein